MSQPTEHNWKSDDAISDRIYQYVNVTQIWEKQKGHLLYDRFSLSDTDYSVSSKCTWIVGNFCIWGNSHYFSVFFGGGVCAREIIAYELKPVWVFDFMPINT